MIGHAVHKSAINTTMAQKGRAERVVLNGVVNLHDAVSGTPHPGLWWRADTGPQRVCAANLDSHLNNITRQPDRYQIGEPACEYEITKTFKGYKEQA